jgi:hypothetical protein
MELMITIPPNGYIVREWKEGRSIRGWTAEGVGYLVP